MIRFLADRKMDPDAVKSTLSNLAFGNVIAAAARDYKKVWSLKLSSFLFSQMGFCRNRCTCLCLLLGLCLFEGI